MSYAPWLRAVAIAAALSPILLPAEALAQPSKPSAEDVATKKATTFFLKGNDFYNGGRYALALEQFKQSFAAVPSPNSHFYIARCLAALGESREAYREFNKVIAEVAARGPGDTKYAQTGNQAKIERDELTPKVALVTITPPAAKLDITVKVGGEIVPRDQWNTPIAVKPGVVPIEIQLDAAVVANQSLTVSAGEKRAVVLDSAPAVQAATAKANAAGKPAQARSSGGSVLRPLAYAAGGVGVVGMVMFAVGGSMSRSTYSSLESQCGKGPCPASLSGDISKGKTQQTVANAGLALGLIGLAAGGTLFALSLGSGKGDAAPKKAGAHLEMGPGYLGVAGQF